MSARLPALLLLLVVPWITDAHARGPSSVSARQQVRRIELGRAPPPSPPEISIHPGTASVLLFDLPIAREGVELEGRERFSRVAVGEDTLALLPSDALPLGERVRLTVRFRDGTAPAEARFLLVVREQADVQVEVQRARPSSEAARSDTATMAEELERLRGENARLRAECGPGGMARAITAPWMRGGGIAFRTIKAARLRITGAELSSFTASSFRALKRVAVAVTLELPRGEPPWTSGSAVLRDTEGHRLRIIQVWQPAPISGDARELRVTVEAEARLSEALGVYTLELREAGGDRTLTLGPLAFPDP